MCRGVVAKIRVEVSRLREAESVMSRCGKCELLSMSTVNGGLREIIDITGR